MGYLSKDKFMEKVSETFSEGESSLLFGIIREQYDDTVLTLTAINAIEKAGFLKKFYEFCRKEYVFPKWIENIEKGIDKI